MAHINTDPQYISYITDAIMPKHHCCVVGCYSAAEKKKKLDKYPWMKDVFFFPFPVKPKERRIWERLVRRENFEVTRHTRICSNHWVGDGPSVAEPNPTIFPYNKKWRDPPGRFSTESHARKRQQAANNDLSLPLRTWQLMSSSPIQSPMSQSLAEVTKPTKL